ncbi:uncharacterized protein LY79DRAFT_131437 [Colletotrichum navitas]|uniref:Uncharacterized protein n=1 Tax=Colletotrichum navitas TaxID=681940 RepID=A0AAD8Q2X6_9PEZI|nr:uncharacterized protein LY79DRAFT_131437 [Colletotrichum navitas]KAK1594523.1 hypothetical protein LY79DRAFT_131437 [Colletotrichum navitas]
MFRPKSTYTRRTASPAHNQALRDSDRQGPLISTTRLATSCRQSAGGIDCDTRLGKQGASHGFGSIKIMAHELRRTCFWYLWQGHQPTTYALLGPLTPFIQWPEVQVSFLSQILDCSPTSLPRFEIAIRKGIVDPMLDARWTESRGRDGPPRGVPGRGLM